MINKKIIVSIIFSLSFLTIKADMKNKIETNYKIFKNLPNSEKAKIAGKAAYSLLSLNHLHEEFEKDHINGFSIIHYLPNITTNYLFYKDGLTSNKKTEPKDSLDDNITTNKTKIINTLKALITKNGLKSIGYANLSALSGLLTTLYAFKSYIDWDDADINGEEYINRNLFFTAPSGYITYRLAKNSADAFKTGYNKVK